MGWSRERGMEKKSNEGEILIERTTMMLERHLVLGKFPRIDKDNPS